MSVSHSTSTPFQGSKRFLGALAVLALVGLTTRAWAADPKVPPAVAPTKAAPLSAPPAAPPPAPPAGGNLPAPDAPPSPGADAQPAAEAAPAAEAPPHPPDPTSASLPLAGGPKERPITKGFPQKGMMILQSTRPPVLETQFEVFDKNILTPNDRFYVDWHPAVIPTSIDTATFRLSVHGNVMRSLSLSMADIKALPKVEIVAVDQAAGNSRGLFQPRVAGTQWGNGAMGNAKWTGVRLSSILAQAGIKPGTVQVRFGGLDKPLPGAPDYMKSLSLAHANDGEVVVAFAMNGEALPVLNGFPLRLVVPGWYGDYWVKMLNDIELLTEPDQNYWTVIADRVPDTRNADIALGTMASGTVPVSRMVPRSFITNLRNGDKMPPDTPALVRGIAMGGDTGVARVDFSADGGQSWMPAKLGKDGGKYSFRQWEATIKKPAAGKAVLMVRCTNTNGVVQATAPNWNPGGLARNAVEWVQITVGSDDAPAE